MSRQTKKILFFVLCLTILSCVFFNFAMSTSTQYETRYIDHIVNNNANPKIGDITVPEDGLVKSDFTSHLPIVLVDTKGQAIPNYKSYNSNTDSFDVPEGLDPYVPIDISVFDQKDHVNSLCDLDAKKSSAKIKIRGNSSSKKSLPKHQYTVKLLDEFGEKSKQDLMGFGKSDTWILSPNVRDRSYIRNYLAFSVAGQLESYQPDIRFCELIFKEGNQYRYGGLYSFVEKIEVDENRVAIENSSSKYQIGQGYLLKKDRIDTQSVILNTWATKQGFYNYKEDGEIKSKSVFMLEYPKKLRETTVQTIENEISAIEKILYDENGYSYKELSKYMDMDSFAEYFILCEFFASYDAGMHSTFFYKDSSGLLKAGPYWDFDGAMDNARMNLTNKEYMVMPYRPWFDCLVKNKKFNDLLVSKYQSLRKTILSDSYLVTFINETQAYLGNSLLRDIDYYSDYYYDLAPLVEPGTNLKIDRIRKTVDGETQRVKDFIVDHGEFLDRHIESLYGYVIKTDHVSQYQSLYASGFILFFICLIVLVRRNMN